MRGVFFKFLVLLKVLFEFTLFNGLITALVKAFENSIVWRFVTFSVCTVTLVDIEYLFTELACQISFRVVEAYFVQLELFKGAGRKNAAWDVTSEI